MPFIRKPWSTRPRKHKVTCIVCDKTFVQLSDPRAEYPYCEEHRPSKILRREQRKLDRDDSWFDNFEEGGD